MPGPIRVASLDLSSHADAGCKSGIRKLADPFFFFANCSEMLCLTEFTERFRGAVMGTSNVQALETLSPKCPNYHRDQLDYTRLILSLELVRPKLHLHLQLHSIIVLDIHFQAGCNEALPASSCLACLCVLP